MGVKLIAVDMDGTFLDDKKNYNRDRFLSQYLRMKEQNIRFVVASGNQYYQLISFFPDMADEIAFVAENGGWVIEQEEDVFNSELSKSNFEIVISKLLQFPKIGVIACGKKSAYTLKSYDKSLKKTAARYYHRLKIVDNFSNINDIFIKFGLSLPDSLVPIVQASIYEILGHIVTPVATGCGNIDLIIPGIHKANGLRILQNRWGIDDSEVVAFGDGGNDIEMLHQAGFGFAMANAKENIKAIARYEAPNNNDEGVLEIIEKILNKEPPFC